MVKAQPAEPARHPALPVAAATIRVATVNTANVAVTETNNYRSNWVIA